MENIKEIFITLITSGVITGIVTLLLYPATRKKVLAETAREREEAAKYKAEAAKAAAEAEQIRLKASIDLTKAAQDLIAPLQQRLEHLEKCVNAQEKTIRKQTNKILNLERVNQALRDGITLLIRQVLDLGQTPAWTPEDISPDIPMTED